MTRLADACRAAVAALALAAWLALVMALAVYHEATRGRRGKR